MSVERHEFFPWDTPENRKTQSVYATLCVALLFFGLVGLVGWLVLSGQSVCERDVDVCGHRTDGAWPGPGVRAMMIAMRLKEKHYFRLVIGTSDGRQIPLVDNNREVLIQDPRRCPPQARYRRYQRDRRFDLNLDIVNCLPKARWRTAPERLEIAAHDVFDEEEDAPPAGH